MPTNPKSITDKDIEEFKEDEMERGTYPTEAEELGGEEGEEYVIIKRDDRPFSERIEELENLLEIYETILEEKNKDEKELQTRSGDILQKQNDIKRDLKELSESGAESDKEIAKEFETRMNGIDSKMERLGI